MNKIRLLILMLFISGVSTIQQAQAQQDRFKWRLGVYGGVMNYYGELENRLFPPNPFLSEDWNTDFLAYGVSLENTFARAWSWKIAYSKGQFVANDVRRGWDNQILIDSPNFLRGLNAKTELQEVSFLMTYFTDNGKVFGRKSFISPYFSFGAGFTNFEVFGDLQNAQGENYFYWSDLTIRNQPEGTPGATIIAQDGNFETNLTQDNPEDYNTNTFNVQAGIGLKFRLGGRFNLNLETMVRQTFTGYLDNFQSSGDAWNDIYTFTSASLHYNFGKRTETFNSPKIYSSPYSADEKVKLINAMRNQPTQKSKEQEIETQAFALQEDSIVVFKDNSPIEKIPSNQLIKGNLMPVITQYQTEGSTLLRRDTVRYETNTSQKRYIIEEQIYRPKTQDTLRFQRYVRDTVYIVKTKVEVQPATTTALNSNPTATYQYNPYKIAPNTYNPYQSPEVNYSNYTPSQARPYPTDQSYAQQQTGQNYSYGTNYNNPQGRSSTNVIVPIRSFGQGSASPSDSLFSNQQRLVMVENKLDILAWHILKMQQENGTLKLDIPTQTDSTTRTLQKVESMPIQRDTSGVENLMLNLEKQTPATKEQETLELRRQVQSLEAQLTNLQKEVKATNGKLEPARIGQMKVVFATNVYTLSATDKAKIKEFVAGRTAKNYRFLLEGYADAVGDSQQNLILSKMRADAVRSVLVELGASMAQIQTEFYGSNISNASERKVEIILMEE